MYTVRMDDHDNDSTNPKAGQVNTPLPSQQPYDLSKIYPTPAAPVPQDASSQQVPMNTPVKKKRNRLVTIAIIALTLCSSVVLWLQSYSSTKPLSKTNTKQDATADEASTTPKAEQLLPIDNPCYSAQLPSGFIRDPNEAKERANKGVLNNTKQEIDNCRQFLVSTSTTSNGTIQSITDFNSQAIGKFEDLKQTVETTRQNLLPDEKTTMEITETTVNGSRALRVAYRYGATAATQTQKTRVYIWNDKKQVFNDESTYKYLLVEALIRNADQPNIDTRAIDQFLQSFKLK